MRGRIKLGVFAIVFMGGLSGLVHAEDLTVPPEVPTLLVSSSETPKRTIPAAKKPKLARKVTQPKSPSPVGAVPALPERVAMPASKTQDDPLSFGLKWKADNQPTTGGPNTSGLFTDYNRNIGGESIGSGGEVGVNYKF